jgi:hypothetical protein
VARANGATVVTKTVGQQLVHMLDERHSRHADEQLAMHRVIRLKVLFDDTQQPVVCFPLRLQVFHGGVCLVVERECSRAKDTHIGQIDGLSKAARHYRRQRARQEANR